MAFFTVPSPRRDPLLWGHDPFDPPAPPEVVIFARPAEGLAHSPAAPEPAPQPAVPPPDASMSDSDAIAEALDRAAQALPWQAPPPEALDALPEAWPSGFALPDTPPGGSLFDALSDAFRDFDGTQALEALLRSDWAVANGWGAAGDWPLG